MKYAVLNPKKFNDTVCIPREILDKHLRFVSAKQLKAILFVISHDGEADVEEIGQFVNCDCEEAEDIMEFWFNNGLVSKNDKQIEKSTNVAPKIEKVDKKPVTVRLSLNENEMCATKIAEMPHLTPADIVRRAGEDTKVSFLLNEAQNIFCRPISHNEQELFVNMIDYYGLELEVVIMLLDYAYSIKKTNLLYLSAVAKNWSDEGIDSVPMVEEKLREIENCKTGWETIRQFAGINSKNATAKQNEFIDIWLNKWKFSLEIIDSAFEIARDNEIVKTFPYVNKILANWNEQGVHTMVGVKKLSEEHKDGKGKNTTRKKPGSISSKPTYDLDEISKNLIAETLKFGGK